MGCAAEPHSGWRNEKGPIFPCFSGIGNSTLPTFYCPSHLFPRFLLPLLPSAFATAMRAVYASVDVSVPERACQAEAASLWGRRAPPRRAPLFLECSSSLSQTVPPSTSLLPDGSLAPVLSEELSCDVPCWRSSSALSRPAG